MSTYLALFKTLHTKLHNALCNHFSCSFSIFLAAFLILFCLVFSRIVVFFLPLVISTSICCVAVYTFVVSQREAAKEVVLVCDEKTEVGLLQVYNEVNTSMYGKHIEVGCFLYKSGSGWTKSGVDEDGENIVFAGKLEAGGQYGALEEDFGSLMVDRLAEGLWNSYFGRCSKWNYITGGCDEENFLELM